MRRRDHRQSFQRDARDQPVGIVASNPVGVVHHATVGVVEVDGRINQLRPLEPDPEQLQVHHAEVGDGQGEEVDRRADGPHLAVGQDDEIQTVRDGSGDDDWQEGHTNVGQSPL